MGGYLITGGRLLDATGASPQDGVSVLVEGNRIRKIGPDREVCGRGRDPGRLPDHRCRRATPSCRA